MRLTLNYIPKRLSSLVIVSWGGIEVRGWEEKTVTATPTDESDWARSHRFSRITFWRWPINGETMSYRQGYRGTIADNDLRIIERIWLFDDNIRTTLTKKYIYDVSVRGDEQIEKRYLKSACFFLLILFICDRFFDLSSKTIDDTQYVFA